MTEDLSNSPTPFKNDRRETDEKSERKAAKKKAKKDTAAKKKADDKSNAKKGNVLHTVSAQGGYELHLCEDREWRTAQDLFDLTSKDK